MENLVERDKRKDAGYALGRNILLSIFVFVMSFVALFVAEKHTVTITMGVILIIIALLLILTGVINFVNEKRNNNLPAVAIANEEDEIIVYNTETIKLKIDEIKDVDYKQYRRAYYGFLSHKTDMGSLIIKTNSRKIVVKNIPDARVHASALFSFVRKLKDYYNK